jgi:hypothetical protein
LVVESTTANKASVAEPRAICNGSLRGGASRKEFVVARYLPRPTMVVGEYYSITMTDGCMSVVVAVPIAVVSDFVAAALMTARTVTRITARNATDRAARTVMTAARSTL